MTVPSAATLLGATFTAERGAAFAPVAGALSLRSMMSSDIGTGGAEGG